MTELNPRQYDAVRYIDGPCLVLAGAGSGKTRVITEKIAFLVKSCGIPARHIVAVTFTNKAAREMKARIGKLLQKNEKRGLGVSTFHTLGLRILRAELAVFGLRTGFSIFDSHDTKQIVKELMMRGAGEEAEDAINVVLQQISRWKNDLLTPAEALSYAKDEQVQSAAQVYAAYDRLLRAYNGVDFDDLIYLPVQKFKTHPDLLEKWQHRIRYLLVDEYQDTNNAQYQLIKQLSGFRQAFTVVGDDDQSIYSWRGARPENLAQLSADFPSLNVIKLEQNYRSTGLILNAANAVIANNPHVFEKKLWSALGYGDPIRVIECKNEESEAEKVASDLLNHRVRHGTRFADYAVLYRGNFQSRLIEMKFQALQIPYKVSGGTSFFSRGEIKDIMAYLRLVINPDDDNAFLRIINVPRREIGSSTLEKLGDYARLRHIGMYAATQELGLEQFMDSRALERVRRFSQWLEGISRNLENTDPVTAIRELISDIDYEAWLYEQNSNSKAAERKIQNVHALVESIKNMLQKAEEEEGDSPDLKAVINKLVLLDILDQQEQEDSSDRVQLMTLHAAKGLEFPHVFLIGVNEQLLPHATSIEEDTVEEERRLFYVGITRAQRTLAMTLSQERRQYGEKLDCLPSRFLDELPETDVHWENLGESKPKTQVDAVAHAHLSNIRNLLKD